MTNGANAGFSANRFSVVEIRFKTGFDRNYFVKTQL